MKTRMCVVVACCMVLLLNWSQEAFGQEKPAILVLGTAYGFDEEGHLTLIDPVLEEKLKSDGYRVASTHYGDLTSDILKKFNVVVMLQEPVYDPEAPAGYEAYMDKVPMIRKHIEEGGGVMTFFDELHYTPDWDYTLNKFLKHFDISVSEEPINDKNKKNIHQFELLDRQSDVFKTTNFVAHPITEGIREWWYPRMTRVVHPGKDWQVVIKAPKTAYTGKTYQQEPPLLVARQYGKGRIAVLPQHSSYSIFDGYHRSYEYGWTFNQGDGYKMFENLYAWLAEPSKDAPTIGGYAGEKMPEFKVTPGQQITEYSMLEDAQPMAGLIGVYTNHSGGLCTVEDFARKARQLGLQFITITDKITQKEDWDKLLAECERASDEKLVVIPGVEFETGWLGGKDGNIGYAINIDKWPPSCSDTFISVLLRTKGDYESLIIVAQPKENNLPLWNFGGFRAMEIASFRGSELFSAALDWYRWLVGIPSIGYYPVVSHRIWSLEQLEEAVEGGFKNYLYAKDVSRIRYAIMEGITPGFVSNGPIIDTFRTETIMRDIWAHHFIWQPGDICKVHIKVSGPAKITDVVLRYGKDIARRFQPNSTCFEKVVQLPLAQDGAFYLETKDINDKVAYSYSIPTRNLNYWNHIGGDLMNDYHNPISLDENGKLVYKGRRYGYGGLVTLAYGWGNYVMFYHPVPSETYHPKGYESGQITAGLKTTRIYPKLWSNKTNELDHALPIRDSLLATRDIALLNEKVRFVNEKGLARESKYINSDTDITIYRYQYRPFGYIIMRVDTEFTMKTPRELEKVFLNKRKGLEVGLLGLTYRTNKHFKEFTYIDPAGRVVTEPIDLSKKGTRKVLKIGKGGYFTMSPDPFGQVGLFVLDGDYEIEIQGGPRPVVWIGHDLDGEPLLLGRRFHGEFIVMEEGGGQGPQICAKLRDVWGLDGSCNYEPKVKGGTIHRSLYTVDLTAENNAIMTMFPKTDFLPNNIIPLTVSGVNGNWTAGAVQGNWFYPGGVHDGTLYIGLENVTEDWYFLGNPLVADNPQVKIDILALSNKHIKFLLHNPTNRVIKTSISTNENLMATSFKKAFTIKPGDTQESEMTLSTAPD